LPEIGGKGLFTSELETELLSGRLQAAVHSLKDLPVESVNGLTIGAIPKRGEVRDVLVSKDFFSLETLPAGAQVGTSSLRRAAQVLALRPDLEITPIRGNVDTRVRKVVGGKYDAAILAGAGLVRLGLTRRIREWLPINVMLPAPGQGALAVQCRVDDEETLGLLSTIDDPTTRAMVTAERKFLYQLGGGCTLPVGAFGRPVECEEYLIRLDGLVASADGTKLIRVSRSGDSPDDLGRDLAQDALAQGAANLLIGDSNVC
jgi:hydroxymethylbilane synthase